MSELIKVDFKSKQVVSRQDLDVIPHTKWEATKDAEFKEWVAGIAMIAETAHSLGGDWKQMVVVVHGEPEGKEQFCITMYDGSLISDEKVMKVLGNAQLRVQANTIGESAQGGEDDPV